MHNSIRPSIHFSRASHSPPRYRYILLPLMLSLSAKYRLCADLLRHRLDHANIGPNTVGRFLEYLLSRRNVKRARECALRSFCCCAKLEIITPQKMRLRELESRKLGLPPSEYA